MRWMERVFGALAAIFGLAALVFTLTQHAVIIHTGEATIYGPGVANPDARTIALTVGFAVVAVLLVGLSAMWDTRQGSARGLSTGLVVVGAALSVASVYLLGANSVWVNAGGSAPEYTDAISISISAALVFAPAALCGIVAALLAIVAALRPRGHAPALA